MDVAPLRLLIWSSIPTHHQSAFIAALRDRNIDVVMHYYRHVDTARLSMGWGAGDELPPNEFYVPENVSSVHRCPDWRDRIHIVPGYGSVFLMRLAWFLSRRGVTWLHWSEHSRPSSRSNVTFAFNRFYGQLVRRHAMGALAIGELARREFIRWGIPAERIRFLPYAVASLGADPILETAPHVRDPHFLFLGTLYPVKGIDVLLLAMRDVLTKHPNARLELVGNDLLGGAYHRDAERMGLSDAVQFSGPVDARRVGEVLRRCDVLVLPSRHDGWGVVLNEAASIGRALISTDACGAAHHLIRPNENGFRVAAGDRNSLAEAMLAYCREPGLSIRHGAQSLRIFEEFTPERNATRFEEALDSLRAEQTGEQLIVAK